MTVGAFKPAEISSFAGTDAGDKERHVGRLRRLLRKATCAQSQRQDDTRSKDRQSCDGSHVPLPLFRLDQSRERHNGCRSHRENDTTPIFPEWVEEPRLEDQTSVTAAASRSL